jgi:hypothetical protein
LVLVVDAVLVIVDAAGRLGIGAVGWFAPGGLATGDAGAEAGVAPGFATPLAAPGGRPAGAIVNETGALTAPSNPWESTA